MDVPYYIMHACTVYVSSFLNFSSACAHADAGQAHQERAYTVRHCLTDTVRTWATVSHGRTHRPVAITTATYIRVREGTDIHRSVATAVGYAGGRQGLPDHAGSTRLRRVRARAGRSMHDVRRPRPPGPAGLHPLYRPV
jgi:hypothetical protein